MLINHWVPLIQLYLKFISDGGSVRWTSHTVSVFSIAIFLLFHLWAEENKKHHESQPCEILDCLRNGVSRLLLIAGPIQNMISSQHQPTKRPKQPPLPFMNKGQVLIERADFPRFCVGFRPILGVRTHEKTVWRKLFVYPIPWEPTFPSFLGFITHI